jgi:hypothetical protein
MWIKSKKLLVLFCISSLILASCTPEKKSALQHDNLRKAAESGGKRSTLYIILPVVIVIVGVTGGVLCRRFFSDAGTKLESNSNTRTELEEGLYICLKSIDEVVKYCVRENFKLPDNITNYFDYLKGKQSGVIKKEEYVFGIFKDLGFENVVCPIILEETSELNGGQVFGRAFVQIEKILQERDLGLRRAMTRFSDIVQSVSQLIYRNVCKETVTIIRTDEPLCWDNIRRLFVLRLLMEAGNVKCGKFCRCIFGGGARELTRNFLCLQAIFDEKGGPEEYGLKKTQDSHVVIYEYLNIVRTNSGSEMEELAVLFIKSELKLIEARERKRFAELFRRFVKKGCYEDWDRYRSEGLYILRRYICSIIGVECSLMPNSYNRIFTNVKFVPRTIEDEIWFERSLAETDYCSCAL